jgi:phosphatidylglycerophosphatase A
VGLQILVIIALGLLGVPICARAARRLGGKDPGSVVWDEFVTLPLIFVGLPLTTFHRPEIACLGFALHRLFDISKLPPARQVESLPDGWGIMADDFVASIYAWIVLRTILACWPSL